MSRQVAVRPVTQDDVAALTALLTADRDHLDLHRLGAVLPGVVVLDGEPVGRVTVNDVVRGAVRCGDLGYWVSRHVTGRGVATAAVAAMAGWAFGGAGLHRLQAGPLPHNAAAQRVLRKSGCPPIGVALRYLCIAGRWQDLVLFQLLHEPGMR